MPCWELWRRVAEPSDDVALGPGMIAKAKSGES